MTAVKAPGKWVRDLEPDTPLAEAARRVLTVRLEGVELLLPPAAERPEEDIEYVHQLRVATRRSGAALRIFAPCLGSGPLRRTRKRLRRLRRAAGAARECDVHRHLLIADREGRQEPVAGVLGEVIARLDEDRCSAQEAIRRAAARYPVRKLRRGRRKLIGSLRNPEPTGAAGEVRLVDSARAELPGLVAALREAAAADLRVLDNLHRMRIAGKRLRYALEIFAPCFDDGFRDAYAAVEAIQEHLGAINDSHELVTRIEDFGRRAGPRPEIAETIDCYVRRRGERVERFLTEWNGAMGDRLFTAQRALVAALGGAGAEASS
jgi:CHAD domain-containing protein